MKILKLLEKLRGWINSGLMVAGGLFLVAMMVLTCANIVFRLGWVPISGTFELMGLFGAVITAVALGRTQVKKENIAVDTLVVIFPGWLKRVLKVVNSILCMGFFVVAAWEIGQWAGTLAESGEVTETLRIRYFPFVWAVAGGCGVLAFVFFVDLVEALVNLRGQSK